MTNTSRGKTLPAFVIGGLALAFALGWWFGHPAATDNEADGKAHVAEASEEEDDTIWTCSMHPQVRQPEPGSCPICGMDLIPATSGSEAADSDLPQLQVSERAEALMNIQTWPVERQVVEREVRLLGRVNFDETRQRTVTAWIPGRLDQLLVNVEGSSIEQGDPVAELYSPALISAQEELLQALQTARGRDAEGSPMVSAARERLQLLGLEDEQIREIEERGTVEDHVTIYSPLDGVITDRVAVEGRYVESGDPIAALAGLDQVFIDLEAYEQDLIWLTEGQTVRFRIEGLGGEPFEGHIDQINPFLDERRRTARVRVLVDNPDGTLKPGMFANATVLSRLGDPDGIDRWQDEAPLIIPATAALITGRRAVVYVKLRDTDEPTFEARQVTLGPRAGDHFVVHDGVSEGERVVTNGNFKIDSELQIRGKPSMMAPEGGAPPGHDHGGEHTDHAAAETGESTIPDVPAGDVDPEFGSEAASVVSAYLELVEGLADDDVGAARAGLQSIQETLAEIGQHRLSGEAHAAWANHYETIDTVLQDLGDEAELDEIRTSLLDLTPEMEAIHKNFASDMPSVHRAYCPMANDDQGATWLQENEEIKNPYFGPSMVSCGEILETSGK